MFFRAGARGEFLAPAEAVEVAVPADPALPAAPEVIASPTESTPAAPLTWSSRDTPATPTRIYSWTLGVDVGGRWGRRERDDASWRRFLGGVVLAFGGYAANKPRFGGGRRFVTPDLFVAGERGNVVSSRDGVLGIQGALRIGLARSLVSRVSPYGKLQLDTRFAAYTRDIAEGNFITFTLRGSAGVLARTREESLVFFAGAAVDGVGGAQRLGLRSGLAQIMSGVEFGLYAQTSGKFALALAGDLRTTMLGESRGGRRIEGQTSLTLRFDVLSVFARYSGTKIEAEIPFGSDATIRERRVGHAFLVGFGLGL